MKQFLVALLLSALFHALLFSGVGLLLVFAASERELPQLDFSSVELSLAQEEDSSAPVSTALPDAAPTEPSTAPETRPPELEMQVPDQPAPEAVGLDVPRPDEEREPLPEMKVREEVVHKPVDVAPPPAPAPQQARIDAPPRLRVPIRPKYPNGAQKRGEHGRVMLDVTISERGRVTAAEVVVSSGFVELDEAALKAVREAEFRPAKANGRAVQDRRRIPIDFRLKD